MTRRQDTSSKSGGSVRAQLICMSPDRLTNGSIQPNMCHMLASGPTVVQTDRGPFPYLLIPPH